MKQRNGVLGLDTAKSVIVTFLILSVTGIAVLLALTSLQSATTATVDTTTVGLSTTDYNAWLNITGYPLTRVNSSNSQYTLLLIKNATTAGAGTYNWTIGLGNATVNSAGLVTNLSTAYPNVSITYEYVNTYSSGRTSAITNNVTTGIESFFASTGTIFSILIVVVIILAISIIIWAVGRFGQQTEGQEVNL